MAVHAMHCCAPLQGTVRMGRQAADEAYVQLTSQAGQGRSRVLLKGKRNVNRAMHGDMVAGASMSTRSDMASSRISKASGSISACGRSFMLPAVCCLCSMCLTVMLCAPSLFTLD